MIWNAFLLAAFTYNLVMVTYTIGGDVNFHSWLFYLIDWIAILIFLGDMWMRVHTALTSYKEISLDKGMVLQYYLDNFLITDLLATVPFEYIMLAFSVDLMWCRWIRLLRLLKFIRVLEIRLITKFHANINLNLFTIFQLFVIYGSAAHVFACCYVFICNREVYQKRRFDGNEMYENITGRPFSTLPPIPEMDHFSRYVQCLYLTSG